jgi:hypothetical protein
MIRHAFIRNAGFSKSTIYSDKCPLHRSCEIADKGVVISQCKYLEPGTYPINDFEMKIKCNRK